MKKTILFIFLFVCTGMLYGFTNDGFIRHSFKILTNPTVTDKITLTDGTDPHIIQAEQEAGLGGRLTFGVDETAKVVLLCDYGDVDVDFGLAAQSNPGLYVYNSAADAFCRLASGGLYSTGGLSVNAYAIEARQNADRASGNSFTFISSENVELTDDNGVQSWVYIEPKINQSSTGAYNALQIKVTETGVGDGSTGTGATNNMFVAGTTADDDMFKMSVTPGNKGNFYVTGNITAGGDCCADFVFDDNYGLKSLKQLASEIDILGHLPGMTQGVGEEKKSLNVGQAIKELIVKVEEQTLYILQLHSRIEELEGKQNSQ